MYNLDIKSIRQNKKTGKCKESRQEEKTRTEDRVNRKDNKTEGKQLKHVTSSVNNTEKTKDKRRIV